MKSLLIDGYNLIRRTEALDFSNHWDNDLGRGSLIDQLIIYKNLKKIAVTLVFDGTYTNNRTIEELKVGGITVLFSAFGQTADDVMINIVRTEKEKVIVVSSDNEIMRAAHSSGSGYLTSEEFFRKLKQTLLGTSLNKDDEDYQETQSTRKQFSTQKKGPAKRLPKAKRVALKRLDR